MTKYLAFDIEIAKEIPEGETDWKAHRPLGITCAAAASSDGGLWNWHANDGGKFLPQMTKDQALMMVFRLDTLVRSGYTLLTWNGLGFDFSVLAEESQAMGSCRELALGHVDMMFAFFCSKGFPLGLETAAKGMSLLGKPEGMTGAKAPKLWANGEYHRVLDYVSWDVKNTLALAQAVEESGRLDWTARSGRPNSWYCDRWLTVKEAMALPEPGTSWMSDPWPRSKFYGWTGHEPESASASPSCGEHYDINYDEMEEEERKEIGRLGFGGVAGVAQWDPDEGSWPIDGPDET